MIRSNPFDFGISHAEGLGAWFEVNMRNITFLLDLELSIEGKNGGRVTVKGREKKYHQIIKKILRNK